MSNESLETRPELRAAIRVLLDEIREGLITSIRAAGEINVEIVSVSKGVVLALLRASGEVIGSGIEIGEELGRKAVRAIREAASVGLEATEVTARSGRKAMHELAETTREMGSDVGTIARASVEGALDIGREVGTDGVRAATEVLSRLVGGATEMDPNQDEALYILASTRYEMAVLSWYQKALSFVLAAVAVLGMAWNGNESFAADAPYSKIPPRVISLDLPPGAPRAGGVIAADLNGDGRHDFLITEIGHVAAYDGRGAKLWLEALDVQITGKSENAGLPGLHAPGVQATDVDGDGRVEVLLLDRQGALHVLDGASGETRRRVTIASPPGTERWEHLVVADFRGGGDRDLLLQATNAEGYRMGRYLAAYALEDLMANSPFEPLWTRDDFIANAHNGARVADLDGDGRDEVLGATVVGPDGRLLLHVPLRGHFDSLLAYDVRTEIPGIEVVALEERGGDRIFLYGRERLLWESHFKHQEPQNAAVGDFDPDRAGLEVWCRSRHDRHQKPFVFDAAGELIAHYEMDEVAPPGWTTAGVEVIVAIHWNGATKQLAAAKERHTAGDVAIFDPLTGRFVHRFREKAERLYVADVSGDWREEIIVLNDSELHVYENDAPNPNPHRDRLWAEQSYKRSKMTWNYYSP